MNDICGDKNAVDDEVYNSDARLSMKNARQGTMGIDMPGWTVYSIAG